MTTFTVRKNGSGTHTDILSAYMAASSGDIVDIGEGTFIESIEIFKNNLTFTGAGRDKTVIQGIPFLAVQTVSVCSWASGDNFFTVGGVAALPAFTVGMSVSDSTSGANSPSGAQITSIDVANRKIYINKNFTTTLSNKIIKHWGKVAAIELRASGFTMSSVKVMDDSNSSSAVELSAIFIGASVANQGASKVTGTSSTGFNISNCEFVAVGDYAMLSETSAAVGNGVVSNCLFSGKTFSGVNSVAGGVRQGVVFQNANLPITFVNNTLDMVCGGMTTANVYSGNQVATIDAYGSIVTGNSFKGRAINASGVYFNLAGLALRMRGGNATVNNNSIQGFNGFTTYGYLILPTYTNLSGKTIPVGEVVTNSSRFFKCTQAHLYAADKTPVSGASWASYWTELTGTAEQIAALLIANGKANYYANSGTNITITKLLIAVTQAAANSFINSEMGKDVLKSISKVSSDAVFSNDANWKLVSYIFKHSSSSRRLISSFRAFESSKKTKLKTNMQAGDVFELYRIIISKSDRTFLVIKRSEISGASGFDFSLLADGPSAPTSPASGVTWDVFFGQTSSNGGGELHTTGYGWGEAAYSSTPLVGDFSVNGTFHSTLSGGTNLMIGFRKSLTPIVAGPSFNISTAIYADGGVGTINGYNGADGTAGLSGVVANATADFSFEISRVGSVITGKVNGVSLFHDDNNLSPVYLASMIYTNAGYGIIGCTRS